MPVRRRSDQPAIGAREERFRSLAEGELPRLHGLARHLIGDNDAEDLVQECLYRACRGFATLEDEAAASAWLSRILTNCFRDWLRSRARKPELVELDEANESSLHLRIADEEPLPYSDSVHPDFLEGLGAEDVRAVLATLPERSRFPLVLVYIAGYHVEEVAAIFDVPLGTMLARLHRGRKQFVRGLWEHAETNDLLREKAQA